MRHTAGQRPGEHGIATNFVSFGGEALLAAEVEQAGGKFGHDEQWGNWGFPLDDPGLKLRYAGFEGVKRFKTFGAVVQLEFDPRKAFLPGGLRRDMPFQIGVGVNELTKIVNQFAFIANIGSLFTGIRDFH